MTSQKLFTQNFIAQQKRNLTKGLGVEAYLAEYFSDFERDDTLINPRIQVTEGVNLKLPDEKNNYDQENAKILFNHYKDLTPTQATDIRLWAYLSHVTFWEYMKKRRPIEKQSEEKRGDYILTHWFVDGLSPRTLSRNDLALFWWGSYLTYDSARENPFELTDVLFSMLDFTRTLVEGTQGRYKPFTHGLLEFVLENKTLFEKYKEGKVRFLMRQANILGGYKIIPTLTKEEIKELFKSRRKDLERFSSQTETEESIVPNTDVES